MALATLKISGSVIKLDAVLFESLVPILDGGGV